MVLYEPQYKPTGSEVARFMTSKGVIRVQLSGKDTPIHVGNFVELAQKGFYDGLKFHRYVPNFIIQGGDPYTRDATEQEVREVSMGQAFSRIGSGGPGYEIKQEFSINPNNHHVDGTLAMARAMGYDTAGSQFYFCLGEQPFLDPEYTVFGQTVEGLDVVHNLRAGDVIDTVIIEGVDSAQFGEKAVQR
ncbi:MAG: peptidylprolyl isomerase [Eggerthellaceae bacterium]|jgi:peptidyl-prolyl cis-trans isomerase B (cyclophilin B)